MPTGPRFAWNSKTGGSTCQFAIVERVLIPTSRQWSAELVFRAWRNACDFWEGNWKFNRGPWKGLELTRGCHSRWLARREGKIESTMQLTWEGDHQANIAGSTFRIRNRCCHGTLTGCRRILGPSSPFIKCDIHPVPSRDWLLRGQQAWLRAYPGAPCHFSLLAAECSLTSCFALSPEIKMVDAASPSACRSLIGSILCWRSATYRPWMV